MDGGQLKKFIPLNKSWVIRMGVLDLVNGYDDIKKFLDKQAAQIVLGDDLLALKRACKAWDTNEPIDVGESGTLYRFLQFASWKLGLNKKFILRGTLKKRSIVHNPKIVDWHLRELLKLDNGTSQWASAAVLLGSVVIPRRLPAGGLARDYFSTHSITPPQSREILYAKIKNPPYKLKLTYEAVKHWKSRRARHLAWKPRYDETILRQAKTYLALLNKQRVKFVPEQAEDYCFARVFNFISQEEGRKRWPSLRHHESDRISEMERVIERANEEKVIFSKDHRVIQAIAMLSKVFNRPLKIKYPWVVNKSWPEFWDFIRTTTTTKRIF